MVTCYLDNQVWLDIGDSLLEMAVDTSRFGLSAESAKERPYLASMGIYVFSRDTLFDLLHQNPTHKDFGKEVIPEALERGDRLKSYVFDDYWEDIGTVRSFFEANLQLCDNHPQFDFYEQNHTIYNYPDLLPMSKFKNSKFRFPDILVKSVEELNVLSLMVAAQWVPKDPHRLFSLSHRLIPMKMAEVGYLGSSLQFSWKKSEHLPYGS